MEVTFAIEYSAIFKDLLHYLGLIGYVSQKWNNVSRIKISIIFSIILDFIYI